MSWLGGWFGGTRKENTSSSNNSNRDVPIINKVEVEKIEIEEEEEEEGAEARRVIEAIKTKAHGRKLTIRGMVRWLYRLL
jgi:hypothetical protein